MIIYVISLETPEDFLVREYAKRFESSDGKKYASALNAPGALNLQLFDQKNPNFISSHMKTALLHYILPRIKQFDQLLAFTKKEQALEYVYQLTEINLDSKSVYKAFSVVTAFIDKPQEKIRTIPVAELLKKSTPDDKLFNKYFAHTLEQRILYKKPIASDSPEDAAKRVFTKVVRDIDYWEENAEVNIVSGKDIIPIAAQAGTLYEVNVSEKYYKQPSLRKTISLYTSGFFKYRTHLPEAKVLEKLLSLNDKEVPLALQQKILADVTGTKNRDGDYYAMLLATLFFLNEINILKAEISLGIFFPNPLIDIIADFVIEKSAHNHRPIYRP
jgi:hypothetical protein